MEACPRTIACPLFKQMSMKSALNVWRTFYCEGNYGRCERWKLVSRGATAPLNLLPNGKTLDVPLEQLDPDHLA